LEARGGSEPVVVARWLGNGNQLRCQRDSAPLSELPGLI
jgi:hypothetical protein